MGSRAGVWNRSNGEPVLMAHPACCVSRDLLLYVPRQAVCNLAALFEVRRHALRNFPSMVLPVTPVVSFKNSPSFPVGADRRNTSNHSLSEQPWVAPRCVEWLCFNVSSFRNRPIAAHWSVGK